MTERRYEPDTPPHAGADTDWVYQEFIRLSDLLAEILPQIKVSDTTQLEQEVTILQQQVAALEQNVVDLSQANVNLTQRVTDIEEQIASGQIPVNVTWDDLI